MPTEILDPDQFGAPDHRVDIYQAGLLFLEFLNRGLPAIDFSDILAGHPRELAEDIVHPAGKAIAKMLRRSVEWRPLSALDAWQEIEFAMRVQ